MSETKSSCSCGDKCETKLLYACSGAANTGFLADQVARKLKTREGYAMTCLAGVGADLSGFIESAKSGKCIVIDGCPVACGAKIFQKNGLEFKHHILTGYGVEKGKTDITQAVIDRMVEEVGRS